MEPDDNDDEARKQRRLRALGCNEPRCAMCGEDRWQTLELHHVAGQAHDPTTIVLCRNCHRVMSDVEREHPPKQESADPYLEIIGRFLLGLADMLRVIVEKLAAFGRELIARACAAEAGAPS